MPVLLLVAASPLDQDRRRPDAAGLKWVWREKIIPLFRPLEQSGFEFELVDASTPNYDEINWPEE